MVTGTPVSRCYLDFLDNTNVKDSVIFSQFLLPSRCRVLDRNMLSATYIGHASYLPGRILRTTERPTFRGNYPCSKYTMYPYPCPEMCQCYDKSTAQPFASVGDFGGPPHHNKLRSAPPEMAALWLVRDIHTAQRKPGFTLSTPLSWASWRNCCYQNADLDSLSRDKVGVDLQVKENGLWPQKQWLFPNQVNNTSFLMAPLCGRNLPVRPRTIRIDKLAL